MFAQGIHTKGRVGRYYYTNKGDHKTLRNGIYA